jgi:2,4-dienoyl-CoA reductase-like NADH-dependent reductase (Old Yellow Enzyme family)
MTKDIQLTAIFDAYTRSRVKLKSVFLRNDMKTSASASTKKFFVGLNTGFVDEHLNPDTRCADFYFSRSGHGLYCAIVGNVVLPSGFGTNGKSAQISTGSGWGQLAKAIASQGAIPGIQFSSTWAGFHGNRKFVARDPANVVDLYQRAGARITREEVSSLLSKLFDASKIAIDHGFRHLQLHAAHGYFFNLAIHPLFSSYSAWTRGQIQNWLDEMRRQSIETSVRISMTTGWSAIDPEYIMGLAPSYDLVTDFIDLSDGFYNINKKKIYPSTDDLSESRFDMSYKQAANYPNQMFIVSGQSKVSVDKVLRNMHLGFCRDLIANPNFILDMKKGCMLCNKCHYFSRGVDFLSCPQWAQN